MYKQRFSPFYCTLIQCTPDWGLEWFFIQAPGSESKVVSYDLMA